MQEDCVPSKKIFFEYDEQRAFQAVLWLLEKHGCKLDKLKIMKLIYLADKEHLLKYGRPIVGGDYYALPLGPISSPLLDDIDNSAKDESFPFALNGYDIIAKKSFDENYLSDSDIEVLEQINEQFGGMDKFRLSDFTHELPEYKSIWPEGKTSGRESMSYESIMAADQEMSEIVKEDQDAWDLIG